MSSDGDPQELEAKFECPATDLQALLELESLGGYASTYRGERRQIDIYFDTAGLALRQRSSSLRVRTTSDGRRKATFKGPRQPVGDGPDSRHLVKRVEIEVDLGAHHPQVDHQSPLPDALHDLEPVVRALNLAAGEQLLVPIATISTHRRVRRFSGPSGGLLEIAIDDVVTRHLASGRETSFGEIELELITGDETALRATSAHLIDAIPTLRPSTRSKLARALGDE